MMWCEKGRIRIRKKIPDPQHWDLILLYFPVLGNVLLPGGRVRGPPPYPGVQRPQRQPRGHHGKRRIHHHGQLQRKRQLCQIGFIPHLLRTSPTGDLFFKFLDVWILFDFINNFGFSILTSFTIFSTSSWKEYFWGESNILFILGRGETSWKCIPPHRSITKVRFILSYLYITYVFFLSKIYSYVQMVINFTFFNLDPWIYI